MSRLRIALLAGAALVLLAVAGGAYALSRPHQAVAPLALSSPAPAASQANGDIAGRWVVDQGSEAGYRVRERFAGQSADSEAVARTAAMSGEMVLAATGGGIQLRAGTFSADLSKLKSQDANATHGSAVRDVFVARIYLETAVYPMATFVAKPAALPSSTNPANLTVAGAFTAHGVTHDIVVQLQVTRNGDRLEVVGSFPLHYPDYKVDVPQVPFTSGNPDATIEVHLLLRRQA